MPPRQPKSLAESQELVQTVDLLTKAAQTVVSEWKKEADILNNPATTTRPHAYPITATLPSHGLYEAQRIVLAATGKLTELVSEPSERLIEVAAQYQESRALYIAAERRIADILAGQGGGGGGGGSSSNGAGKHISDISKEAKIESRKLSRILRCLSSMGIFKQTGQDVFANNSISAALVSNEPLRAFIRLANGDAFSASDRLPHTLLNPQTGSSYDVAKTSWQNTIGTTKSRWEWIEERVKPEELVPSGVHYPGIPSLVLEPQPQGEDGLLSKAYPDLRFVVQDRAPVAKQGQELWLKEKPDLITSGRVKFLAHDFFTKNPVEGADIYFLRYIIHDWSDEYCVRILSAVRQSMAPHSRVLICDQVMNTTLGSPYQTSAPAPLPANYGYHTRFSHSRDITMMATINGIERTPEEFKAIIEAAGLKIRQILAVRSQVSLIEAELA
ncbi:hypothetical protein DV737_g1338, partial [Chaetothyriales sp. CBS 132003]